MNPTNNSVLRLIACGMLLVPFAAATQSRASENEDTLDSVQEQSEAAGKLFDTDRFFVMPIPISNPIEIAIDLTTSSL